jgi:predicted enzyme related to lactoylglutathione lyase
MDQGRMLVGQDTAGAMFGIWEPRAHAGAQIVNEHASFSWNELTTNDLEAATRFYGAVFDVAFEELPDTPPDVAYKTFQIGGQTVAGVNGMGGDESPFWLTYFMYDDVDAGFERVRELGGELLGEPFDSSYGRFARVRDPQGAVFALIKSQS